MLEIHSDDKEKCNTIILKYFNDALCIYNKCSIMKFALQKNPSAVKLLNLKKELNSIKVKIFEKY